MKVTIRSESLLRDVHPLTVARKNMRIYFKKKFFSCSTGHGGHVFVKVGGIPETDIAYHKQKGSKVCFWCTECISRPLLLHNQCVNLLVPRFYTGHKISKLTVDR